jgi:hypothetical membrane protein
MQKLLYAGVVGPLLFIAVFLIEGVSRPGYSAWRNFVSQLATGPGGWVQVANFLIYGALMVAFAIGLRGALFEGRASIAAPALFAAYGLALITAGIFVTDPALGYPVGAPQVHTTHGLVHGLAGLVTFALLAIVSFVMAWRFAADAITRRWAIYSVLTGLLIIASFIASNVFSAMDATGSLPNAPTGLVQRITIIGGWTWIAMVALHFIRVSRHQPSASPASASPHAIQERPPAA